MSRTVILRVDGAVKTPMDLTFADLEAFPESDQIEDVSRFHPTRKGDGVALDAILDQAGIEPNANYVTLHADRDDFHVSVSLAALRGQGIVVYRLGPDPLAVQHGGPVRLLIRDPSQCHAGELDDCSNIKYLSRIELSHGAAGTPGPRPSPSTPALHEAEIQPGQQK